MVERVRLRIPDRRDEVLGGRRLADGDGQRDRRSNGCVTHGSSLSASPRPPMAQVEPSIGRKPRQRNAPAPGTTHAVPGKLDHPVPRYCSRMQAQPRERVDSMQHAEITSERPLPAWPDWLSAWRAGPICPADALARFDGLAELRPDEMLGRWRGAGLANGHPLDGVLEALGWHGKAFETPDHVQPLLFRSRAGRIVALDPALMPVGIALRWPGLARSGPVRAAFSVLRPLLRARQPTARLRLVAFRGKVGAAMIYDRQPIIDHFRRIDAVSVLGLMEMRGDLAPYFFLLVRDGGDGHVR